MPRSMWRGAIQFGLVTIPVKLYLATEPRGGLSFNMLHRDCGQRIQMKTHCPEHGEISRADTVRGFEYSKGQYVVIDEADLESVPLKTLRSIEIELFVDAQRDSHGANFVKQAYYLEPEPIGRKAFYLLKSVLAETNLSAICKIVLKDREALASLNPYSRTMLLTTLYWPDEVRTVTELDLPEQEFEFKAAERAMAEQLVLAMRGEFRADDYHDDYRQALLAVIEAKVAGQEPTVMEPVRPETSLVDLMSVLEASVAAVRSQKQAATPSDPADVEPVPVASRARKGRAAASAGTPAPVGPAGPDAEAEEARPRRAARVRKSA
jgi:DNA end-binding protein Ku